LAIVIAVLCLAMLVIGWLIRRHQRRTPTVTNEWQARTAMGELCPDGWQARITAYGRGAPLPSDAPRFRSHPVELEWRQYGEEQRLTPRHLWAPSVESALQEMVERERTAGPAGETDWAAEADRWLGD